MKGERKKFWKESDGVEMEGEKMACVSWLTVSSGEEKMFALLFGLWLWGWRGGKGRGEKRGQGEWGRREQGGEGRREEKGRKNWLGSTRLMACVLDFGKARWFSREASLDRTR
jgi:hypothetical protein